MQTFKKILKNLDTIVISVTLSAVCLVLLAQVFFRYVLNNPLIWSEELARYLFIWLTLLGLGYNIRTENNISMTLLYNKMPRRLQVAVDFLPDLIAIVLFTCLIPTAVSYFLSQRLILSSAMKLPLGFLAVSVPLSFSLVVIQAMIHLVRKALALRKRGGAQ